MLRGINPTILLVFIVVVMLSFGISAGAQPDEGDVQVSEEDATGEARTELERLRREVLEADGARGQAADQKQRVADEIADTQRELAAAKESREEAENELADTASNVYRGGEIDPLLDVVLGTQSFEELSDRLGLATRLIGQRRDAVEEASETEDKLTSELEERREQLQEWDKAVTEAEDLEEQARQAEAEAQAYLDGLDEEVRQEIEAEQARQAELDEARSEELLGELAEDGPALLASPQDLDAAQERAEKLAEIRGLEQKAEEDVARKVIEAEQARLDDEEQAGLDAEQAATEAAELAEAAEKARQVTERDAALGQTERRAALKEAEGQPEVSDDGDGVISGGDRLRVEGDFSISPGSSVVFEDADGTRGTAIDGVNANIVEGSIDTTMTAPLNNVTGGDGQLGTEGLGVVDTTGIGTGQQYLANPAGTAGLQQYAPGLGAGGAQYDMGLGVTGTPYAPGLGTAGAQYDQGLGIGRGGPATPAASGQPGLQKPAGGGGGSGSGSAALGIAAGLVGMPYAWGTDGPSTFSCTGLVRYALRSLGLPEAPWDHGAYLSQYPTVSDPAPGDVVVYPDGVGMYAGDNTVLMANHADGRVGYYPMDSVGTPIGFARPY